MDEEGLRLLVPVILPIADRDFMNSYGNPILCCDHKSIHGHCLNISLEREAAELFDHIFNAYCPIHREIPSELKATIYICLDQDGQNERYVPLTIADHRFVPATESPRLYTNDDNYSNDELELLLRDAYVAYTEKWYLKEPKLELLRIDDYTVALGILKDILQDDRLDGNIFPCSCEEKK